MKDLLSETDGLFPVRNSTEQKKAFRAFALTEAEKAGVIAAEEENEGHVNLVFSDPEKAEVIFTAHYDTPRRALLPNMMFVTNRLLFYLYLAAVVSLMLIPAVAAAFAVKAAFRLDFQLLEHRLLMILAYLSVYFGLFTLLMHGPANKRNLNDNTSGTAAILELVLALGDNKRAAFILFDDEEKGKKGSKAYAKAHPEIKKGKLIVNLDCVGNGGTFVFCGTKGAEEHPAYDRLVESVGESGINARFFASGKARMNSDHRSFDKAVGVCACTYKKGLGYYTGRIHTKRDSVADSETVGALAKALASFVENME
ncbi:MAG: Zn-dependent exopeptidase M28 [Clostridiales bacterium]|nr:Zn-dependent exopeptidase M28 [Clostridiales bacterium]